MRTSILDHASLKAKAILQRILHEIATQPWHAGRTGENRLFYMPVNHQHLRAFQAVATEGSFSRAARRLNVSQPTLSQQIKSLEGRHRARLFERRGRVLALTPLGDQLLQLTRTMFTTSRVIEDLLGEGGARSSIALRLASDQPVYAALLTRALLAAGQAVELSMPIAGGVATLAAVLDARVDAAIVTEPDIDQRLIYKPLFVDYLLVCTARDHACAGAAQFPLEALGGERLIVREAVSRTRIATESILRAHDIRPAVQIEMHSREAIREAVALGLGVSLFFSAECPPDTRLAYHRLDVAPGPGLATGYLVYGKEHRRSPNMQALCAAAADLEPLSPHPLPHLSIGDMIVDGPC